jgi:hypothetical protein
MNHKILVLLERISTYLPLVGTVLILLISTFYSDILRAIPLSLLLAIMAISFILTAVHLETQLHANSEVVRQFAERMKSLEEAQREYLKITLPPIRTVSLAEGFEIASTRLPRIDHLRVFAISSQQILGFMRFHPFEIKNCSLLLRGFADDDQAHRDFRKQIELVVRDWRVLQRDGRIKNLTVRSYDFFPTEYECIFDDDFMLLGLYDSDPSDYSEVRVRKASMIESSTLPAESMIAEYIDRFDKLFDLCKSHHHGPDSYNLP